MLYNAGAVVRACMRACGRLLLGHSSGAIPVAPCACTRPGLLLLLFSAAVVDNHCRALGGLRCIPQIALPLSQEKEVCSGALAC